MVVRWWGIMAVVALACGGGGGGGPAGPVGGGGNGGGGGGGGGQVSGDVLANASTFQPVDLTVRVGGRVEWTNNSSEPHTVTSDTRAWTAGSIPSRGTTFSRTFSTPGDFPYHCVFHGAAGGTGMHGTIHVTP